MIKIFETDEELAEVIATEMEIQLKEVEKPVFCLAAGSTPAKTYKRFIDKCATSKELKKLKFVSLDEWVGVSKSTIGSCYQMLEEDLFGQLPLEEEQIVFFETVGRDLESECKRIDTFIEENKITFSLMGVGMNGHIGLNEPGTLVKSCSSVMPLSNKTKEVATKYFNEQVQLEDGITLGLQQVVDSERVVVVITGEHKKHIVKEIIENPQANLPAQVLLGHKHIDFFFDRAAAKLLSDDCIEEFNK